jgi:hypothetical protein
MPRKKSPEGGFVDTEGKLLKAVRVELTADDHKRLRVLAANNDMSMGALVRGLIKEHLARKEKK